MKTYIVYISSFKWSEVGIGRRVHVRSSGIDGEENTPHPPVWLWPAFHYYLLFTESMGLWSLYVLNVLFLSSKIERVAIDRFSKQWRVLESFCFVFYTIV